MHGDPVVLPGATARTLTSASGRQYRILTAVPPGDAPAGGFPIVTVLDAERIFATMVESIRMRARRPDATGVGPAIVVGVTPVAASGDARGLRTFDFTPGPAVEGAPDEIGDSGTTGGASSLLGFLADELSPWLATAVPVDRSCQMLFGHSLGAYFVLWSMLRGAPFTTYVAASPSIWWDPRALYEPLTAPAMARGTRVMVTVGEYEERQAPWQPAGPRTDDALRRRGERRMVASARDLADALARVMPAAVDFHEFPGEDHASVVVLTVARSLRFGLPPACRLASRAPIPTP